MIATVVVVVVVVVVIVVVETVVLTVAVKSVVWAGAVIDTLVEMLDIDVRADVLVVDTVTIILGFAVPVS